MNKQQLSRAIKQVYMELKTTWAEIDEINKSTKNSSDSKHVAEQLTALYEKEASLSATLEDLEDDMQCILFEESISQDKL